MHAQSCVLNAWRVDQTQPSAKGSSTPLSEPGRRQIAFRHVPPDFRTRLHSRCHQSLTLPPSVPEICAKGRLCHRQTDAPRQRVETPTAIRVAPEAMCSERASNTPWETRKNK